MYVIVADRVMLKMFVCTFCGISLGLILLCGNLASCSPIRFPIKEEQKITYDMLREITIFPALTNYHSYFASGYFNGDMKRENLTRVEEFPSVLKFNMEDPDSQYMTQVNVFFIIASHRFSFFSNHFLLKCLKI